MFCRDHTIMHTSCQSICIPSGSNVEALFKFLRDNRVYERVNETHTGTLTHSLTHSQTPAPLIELVNGDVFNLPSVFYICTIIYVIYDELSRNYQNAFIWMWFQKRLQPTAPPLEDIHLNTASTNGGVAKLDVTFALTDKSSYNYINNTENNYLQ